MQQITTITGKMQLTVPMSIVKKFGLKKGQKVIFTEKDGQIVLTPALQLVEELAGSLKGYKKSSAKSFDKIIEEAKKTYFRNKEVNRLKNP